VGVYPVHTCITSPLFPSPLSSHFQYFIFLPLPAGQNPSVSYRFQNHKDSAATYLGTKKSISVWAVLRYFDKNEFLVCKMFRLYLVL